MAGRYARVVVFVSAIFVAVLAVPVAVAAPNLPQFANLTLTMTQQSLIVTGGTPPGAIPVSNLAHGCEFKTEAAPVIIVAAGGNISGGCNYFEPASQFDPFNETWTGSYSGTMNTTTGQVSFTHITQHIQADPVSGKTETYNITWNGTTSAHNDAGGSGPGTFSYARTCVPGTSTCSAAANMSYSGTISNFNFILDGPVTGVDVEVDHIEVVQVVQTTMNTVPLVADKTTVARVFFSTPLEAPITSLTLKARRNGILLNDQPTLLAGGATVARDYDSERLETDSVNFRLPMSWVTAGEIELEAVLVHGGPSDPNPTNNTRLENVTFQSRNPLKVAHLELCIRDNTVTCSYDASGVKPAIFQAAFPLADDGLKFRRYKTPSIIRDFLDVSTEEDWIAELRRINAVYLRGKLLAPTRMPDQLFLWIPYTPYFGGIANTRAFGGSGNVSFVNWNPSSPEWSYATLVHEVAHNFGADHPATADSCGSLPAFPEPDWPYANARVQEVGWNMLTGNVVDPATAHDFMSYCFEPGYFRWMSPHTYSKLFTANSVPAFTTEPRISTNFIIVGGTARADGTSGTLDNVEGMTSTYDPPPSKPTGTHCLRFNDTPAMDYCFDLTFTSPEGHQLSEAGFIHALPEPFGISNLKLCKAPCGPGDTLATLSSTPNWPTASITSPQAGETFAGDAVTVTWSGSDLDAGPNLTYSLYYSNGTEYTPIVVNTSGTSATFDTAEIGGGAFSYFKVSVSDGVNRSETTVGPIALGETLPWGDILCNGALDLADAVALRRVIAGFDGSAGKLGCPATGEPESIEKADLTGFQVERTWGDLDCTGGAGANDVLSLLRSLAGLSVTPGPGTCPDVGEPVYIANRG